MKAINEIRPDLCFKSAAGLGALIRNREITVSALITYMYERIAKVNPRLNALVTLNREAALKEAAEADADLAQGIYRGHWHGIPVTIKDNISVQGMRTTAGSRQWAEHYAEKDAAVVRRIRAAGAIILGKTNMPELACDLQTNNRLFGVTNNPWDLARTPGGSSGGEAAAVAAGMSFLGVGNDLLASIRLPAHFCGVFSFVPTAGTVPAGGIVPGNPPGGLLQHFFRIGFLARSLDDLEAAYRICAGYDPAEPLMCPFPVKEAGTGSKIRVAYITHINGAPVSRGTVDCIRSFAQSLTGQGVAVTELDRPVLDHKTAVEVWLTVFNGTLGARMPPFIRLLAGIGNPRLKAGLSRYLAADCGRQELIRQIESLFTDYDLLISPVSSTPAFEHIKPARYSGPVPVYKTGIPVDDKMVPYSIATGSYCFYYPVTGNPVVTLPVGNSCEGLPVSVQVIGKRFADLHLLDLAKAICREIKFREPPLFRV